MASRRQLLTEPRPRRGLGARSASSSWRGSRGWRSRAPAGARNGTSPRSTWSTTRIAGGGIARAPGPATSGARVLDRGRHQLARAAGSRSRLHGEAGHVPRVLALGDSFVEGYTVPEDQTVTQVLERAVSGPGCPAEVLNAGHAAYSTDQEYLFYRDEGVKYAPQVVLVFFYYNDIVANTTANYSGRPSRALEQQDGTMRLTNDPVPRPAPPAPRAAPVRAPLRKLYGSVALEWLRDRLARGAPRAYNVLAGAPAVGAAGRRHRREGRAASRLQAAPGTAGDRGGLDPHRRHPAGAGARGARPRRPLRRRLRAEPHGGERSRLGADQDHLRARRERLGPRPRRTPRPGDREGGRLSGSRSHARACARPPVRWRGSRTCSTTATGTRAAIARPRAPSHRSCAPRAGYRAAPPSRL